MRLKAAIFDLDGTLLDSMYYWRHMFELFLESYGKKPKPDLKDKLKPLSLQESADVFRLEYGVPGSTDEVAEGINKVLEERYFHTIEAKPHVREFLELLQKNGVKICAATATDRYLVEAALKRTGLYDYFSQIYTCTEVGRGKEFPDIYLKAMEFTPSKRQKPRASMSSPWRMRRRRKMRRALCRPPMNTIGIFPAWK